MPDWPGAREWAERRGKLAVANLPWFEDHLSTRRFLAGDDFSMADITLFAALAFAKGAGLPLATDTPALTAWHARVNDLPSVRNRSGQTFLPEDISRRQA